MDIDYIISALLLGGGATLAAYLLGHAKGRIEGFNHCSRIWAGTHRTPARALRRGTDVLDSEELI